MAKWKLASINTKKTMLTSDLIITKKKRKSMLRRLSHSEKKGAGKMVQWGKALAECQNMVQGKFWVPVRKWQESCDLSFFKNTDLFLGWVFRLLPGVADEHEFELTLIVHHSWLLLPVYLPLWRSIVFGTCSLSLWLIVHFTHETLLSPQSIDVWCSECRWPPWDFSLSHSPRFHHREPTREVTSWHL